MRATRSALAGSSSSISEMARAIARGSPATTRSANVAITRPPRSSRQELAGDHQALDLARPLADGRQLHVAEIFLGRVILDEAVAAVNLDAVVRHLHCDLARVELRHRRLEGG